MTPSKDVQSKLVMLSLEGERCGVQENEHFLELFAGCDDTNQDVRLYMSFCRKLAVQWHPDKHPEDVEAAKAKFQEINAAYTRLMTSNEDERVEQLEAKTKA
jgi:hypothetical protein